MIYNDWRTSGPQRFSEKMAWFTVHPCDSVRKMSGCAILAIAYHWSHPSDVFFMTVNAIIFANIASQYLLLVL